MESSFQSMDQYYCKYFQLNRLMYNLKCIKENEMYLILPFIHSCESASSSWSPMIVVSSSANLSRTSSLLKSMGEHSRLKDGRVRDEDFIAFKMRLILFINRVLTLTSVVSNKEGMRSQSIRKMMPSSWGVKLAPPTSASCTWLTSTFILST